MSTAIFRQKAVQASQNRPAKTAWDKNNTAAFTTDWVQFMDTDICVALYGTATNVVAIVERSAADPNAIVDGSPQGPFASPADATGFSGDLSAGIEPNIYTEAGVGWWRLNVSSVSGGNCTGSLSGKD